MNDLFRAINRRMSARKNGTSHFDYSMEQGKIYISFPFENEKSIVNDNLKDVLS